MVLPSTSQYPTGTTVGKIENLKTSHQWEDLSGLSDHCLIAREDVAVYISHEHDSDKLNRSDNDRKQIGCRDGSADFVALPCTK